MNTSLLKDPHMNIKKIRELKHWSQEFVADALGISTRAYSKIESGETLLNIKRLNEIGQILQVDPIKILLFNSKNIFLEQQSNPETAQLIAQYEKTIHALEEQIYLLKRVLDLPKRQA